MKTLSSLILVFISVQAFSQFRLPAIFGDHMVLQRNKPVKIWGTASPGEKINVSLASLSASVKAGQNGKWMVTLPAFSGGGPFQMVVKTKKEVKTFLDIWFGEVWLCSGQSNMQFRVRQAMHAAYDIHRAANPLIRQVVVPNKLSFHPEIFIDSTSWVLSTPQTTGDFTAVGYFFALDIFDRLHVPVGLIYDNWGGSQVESWISKKDMEGSDELKDYARQMPDNWEQTNNRIEKQVADGLKKNNNGSLPDASEENILKAGYSFSGWMPSSAPGDLDWIGLPAYRGEVYLMKEIIVDSVQSALPSILSLGGYDSRFDIFLNGKKLIVPVEKNILISLPPSSWKQGKNILLLAIRKQDPGDHMSLGIHGSPDLLFLDFDGERISIAGSQWKMLPLLDRPHYFTQWMNSEGAIIYNAMIHPIVPVSIRGVLWYQGESNTDRAREYGKTFPLMIESWRKEWNDSFPFLFVQLSSYGSDGSANAGSSWAELREAQSSTLELPGTGMAVTTDIGEANDIHPKNKQDVGRRLAAIALNDVYRIPQICRGPVYQSVSFVKGQAILSFTSAGKGLVAKNRYGNLVGFEIAGADRKFYFARAFIANNQILVSSDSVISPVAVRYAWSNAPVDSNLFNAEGFPASPFRTDHWPGITDAAGFFKK